MSYRQVTLNKNLARMPRFADSMRSYGIAMKDLHASDDCSKTGIFQMTGYDMPVSDWHSSQSCLSFDRS